MSNECPKCTKSWVGAEIPTQDRDYFGGATHFKLEISVYSQDSDSAIDYMCPFCGCCFNRDTFEFVDIVDLEEFFKHSL